MSEFHFLRPEWFWGLIPALLLLLWLARRQLRSHSWQAICDPELLPHLLLGRSVRRANWPLWLLLLGLLLSLLALAGPVWKHQPQPLFRQQSALVVLFDLSRSMQATDLTPSRFLRARLKIEDLLRQRKEGQTALIVFAGDAFVVTPLTTDRHTIAALLKSLSPELMPVQGSNVPRAIQLGQKLLQQAGLKQGRLLLVTDEDRPGDSLKAAQQLVEQGFELAVLGVGTAEGAPIPEANGGFFKDNRGNLVLPKLNSTGLQQLASTGAGSYHSISVDDTDLRSLMAGLDDHKLNQPGAKTSLSGDTWRDEGVWLLFPLAFLTAFAFRRGWLLILPLILSPMLWPSSAEAIDWQRLWNTPNQQAAQAFSQQEYARAAKQFEDSRWKASALYRDGQFAEAAELLQGQQSVDDLYNKGNALARHGDLANALKAYQEALKQNPEHADARYNKEVVEQELQKQQEQQKKGNKNDQGNQQKQSEQKQERSQKQKPSPEEQTEQNQSEQSESKSSFENDKQTPQGQPAEQTNPEEEGDQKKAETSQSAQQEQRPSVEPTEKAFARDEQQETAEQRESRLLLQQIPDDPGGLMRRKFLYQYRQRGQQMETERPW